MPPHLSGIGCLWASVGTCLRELRNPRQRMEEVCGFLQPKRMHAKSQTLPDLPRRLGAPRQRALRRGSRIKPKETFNNRREHNTRTHPHRIARQRSEAGRRSTRGSMRLEVKARPKGVRSSRITPKNSARFQPHNHTQKNSGPIQTPDVNTIRGFISPENQPK